MVKEGTSRKEGRAIGRKDYRKEGRKVKEGRSRREGRAIGRKDYRKDYRKGKEGRTIGRKEG